MAGAAPAAGSCSLPGTLACPTVDGPRACAEEGESAWMSTTLGSGAGCPGAQGRRLGSGNDGFWGMMLPTDPYTADRDLSFSSQSTSM